MGAPVFLADSLFSKMQYPSHTIVANEAAAGFEAFRVADGRRSPFDYWTPTTANASANVKVTCDRTRAANVIVLDRGHNLAGRQIKLEASDDDFTTTQTVLDLTMPSASAPGALDESLGVRTEEGAWVKRFPARAASYWRLTIPAMGAGLKPKVVGLWLGLSYSPDFLSRPHAPDEDELVVQESESDWGWIGRGETTPRRTGTILLKLTNLFDYDLARFHLQGLFGRGRPMWIVQDSDVAERAVLAIRPRNRFGFSREPDWFYHQGQIEWTEWEPSRS